MVALAMGGAARRASRVEPAGSGESIIGEDENIKGTL
jgi:hypothetical protein